MNLELKKLVKDAYYDALKCAKKNNDDISNTIDWNYWWKENENKFKNLFISGVSGSTFIAVSKENNKAYLFDKSEMYLWENDETVDIYEAKYYR